VSGADTLDGLSGATSVPTLTREYSTRISTVPGWTTGLGMRATTTPLMFIKS
jgi:hypothetical protein